MKIRWHGMSGTQHSWSFVTQALARAMEKIGGHEIFIRSTNGLEHFPDDLRHLLVPGYHGSLTQGPTDYIDEQGNQIKIDPKNPLSEIPDKNAPYDLELAYTIFYQAPRRFFPHSKARAIIWNFESSILPPGWQEYHRALDYILPSSQYSLDIFAANGIPREKMLVVPHGVDTKLFNPEILPFPLKTKKKIKFLHNAIPHHRKLHERVLKGYFDAFDGNDDVCLVLKTEFLTPSNDKPFEVDVRTLLEKMYKSRKNPPEVEIVNTFIPNIGSLYTACNSVVSMSSCEGFCLLPGIEVDTLNGPKPIENLNNDDKILTHEGNFTKVSGITNRKVEEEVFGINRMGSSDTVWGTKNHPILAIKKNNIVQKPFEAEWVGLGDIEIGDYVVIPKPKLENMPTKATINIDDFVENIERDGEFRFYKNGFGVRGNVGYKQIAKLSGCSYETARLVLLNKIESKNFGNKIVDVAKNLGWVKPEPIKCKNIIDLNEKIMEFFGLYIAEGCDDTRKNASIFSSHKNEIYARELEKEILSSIFNCKPNEKIIDNTGIVCGSSKIASSLLSTLFGNHAKIKKIPTFLWKNKNINFLIRGIFYGDGSVNNKTYQFSTSSKQLVNDLFMICLANGIFLHITKLKGKYPSFCLSVARQYRKRFYEWIKPIKYDHDAKVDFNSKYETIIEGEEHFLVPVVKKYSKKYKGNVYNLHVNKYNDFTTSGFVVHNCLPLLEALACESLIIAPRHGGQLDFLNDDNSLLVDTSEMKAPLSMQYWTNHPEAVVGDPNTQHFSELLRRVYENPDKEKARVKESAKATVEKFTWENAAQMILDLPIPETSKKLTTKRKVLYIVPYTMVGGGEVWVKEAIKQLDRTVYEPHIACVNGATDDIKELFKDSDVIIEDLGSKGRQFALKCLVESENYSIIHFYNSFGVYNILRNAWNQGYRNRIVETVHSELVWSDSMTKVASRDKMVSLIVAVSNNMAQKLIKNGNKNVAMVQQQVDWNRFKTERHKGILEEFNIPTNFVVGFVGRLSPEKNVPVILQCARGMPDTSFVIIGDGPQSVPLKQMASSLKNVFFLGKRTDVEKFYASFDVLMLPSKMEGMPLVILEAMTSGTPIVASDVGAITEVVKDGVSGFISKDPNDYLLFITCLAKLKNQKIWQECSDNSKAISNALEAQGNSFNINNVYNMLFKRG